MLPINIDEVCSEHITSLITEKVSEHKILEYKESLPDGSDGARKEFLADVCSFANATGGDIIYGIRDERGPDGRPTGIPERIVGVLDANPSTICTRLETMVRDGIKPRVANVQAKTIAVTEQETVVLLRTGRSWIRPHMVTYKGTSRFYSRHSSGKYQLDVQEIGQAFAEQRSLGEELRDWRAKRVALHVSGDGPVPLHGPGKILLHFVPVAALVGVQISGLWPPPDSVKNSLKPTNWASNAMRRYNADGLLIYNPAGNSPDFSFYVQMFRDGCLEYGDGAILNPGRAFGAGREREVPSKAFEEVLTETFENALQAILQLGIEDPVYFSCALIGAQGLRLSQTGNSFIDHGAMHSFDRQVILTPDVQINRSESRPYRNSVLPVVNSIWQACGYEKTPFSRAW